MDTSEHPEPSAPTSEELTADLILRKQESERLMAENMTLRALLPKLKEACVHCGLTEIAKCELGFPGCAAADDLLCFDQFQNHRLKAALGVVDAADKLNGYLEKYSGHTDDYPVKIAVDNETDREELTGLFRTLDETLTVARQFKAPNREEDNAAR